MPIQKDDEVQVVQVHYAEQQTGNVVQVHGKEYVSYTEGMQQEKANVETVHVDVHPNKVVVTRLELDKHCKKVLDSKANCHKWERNRAHARIKTIEKMLK